MTLNTIVAVMMLIVGIPLAVLAVLAFAIRDGRDPNGER